MRHRGISHFLILALRSLLPITIVAFLFLRCNDNVNDSSTVVPLAVKATYPPNNATGPFNIYTPVTDTVRSHFTVQFTTFMDLSSFTPSTITCEGFPIAVNVLVDYLGSHGNVIAFRIIQKNANPYVGAAMTYRVGASYTINIDSTVKDLNGKMLGKKFKFSFKPEPYFRVVKSSFRDGDTLIPSGFEIFFNSKIKPQTVGAISFNPALANDWTINPVTDSCSVKFNIDEPIRPSTTYAIVIAPNANDNAGNILHAAVTNSFFSPPIRISSTQFPEGINSVNLSRQLMFKFNYLMDTTTVREALTLNPPTPSVVTIGQSQATLYAIDDFVPNTNYTVQLTTHLKTMGGYALSAPVFIAFHTAEFAMTHSPVDGARGVSTHELIQLDFTGAVVSSTVESAVTITPPFEYRLTFEQEVAGKVIHAYFIPAAPLGSRTTYHVTIAPNIIRSISGYQIARPDSFQFTTE